MMDHAELDFGIYRIMNQKRDDIQNFLENRLLKQVGSSLDVDEKEVEKLQKRQKEILEMAGGDISILPLTIPLRKEYDANEELLHKMGNPEELRNEVFSHLVTFFSRYYEGGDFLSKRRYKADTYAIPYNGEEVKLHWANSDQYYIKTSEYFRDYTFELPTSRKKVHFVLKDVSTERNKNRAANNMERRFALYEPEEDTEEKVVEMADNDDLNIYFTYELMPKATKQDDLKAAALEKITSLLPADYKELVTTLAPLSKKPERTLLEKHLTDYMAKNSFDYFIHKDLGGFLRRELDFYLKNEVINIDDLDEINIQKRLGVAKAIKNVGQKIIQMLAQLENFQKKLWLKKKFVVQSDYCITIDRVPEKLYPEIIANEVQRKEWVRLFAIDEIQEDLHTVGYSEPLTIEFLKQNQFLVLDTFFFDEKFKHQLIKSMENIDEQTNGLLVKSDNFHALALLINKYNNSVNAIYIDPPYNTGSDGFVYKDSYKDSSWLSMMENRLSLAKKLMTNDSSIAISINENELFYSKCLLDNMFAKYLTTFSVKVRHEDRILKGDKDFHEVYESLLMYAYGENFKPLKRQKDNSSDADYLYTIEVDERPDEIFDLGNKDVEAYAPGHYKIIKHKDSSFDYLKPISVRGSIREGNSSGRFYVAYLENLASTHSGYIFKVPNMGDDKLGYRFFWTPSVESGRKNGDYYQGAPLNRKDVIEIPYPNYVDFEKAFNDATDEGGIPFRNGKKPVAFLDHVLSLQNVKKGKDFVIADFFAGSGSTGHAVIEMNKDKGKRKYLLSQVGDIFDNTTKPRIEKAIYSNSWKDERPVSRKGVSQCFKYIRLEQYEDTLNNLKLKKQELEFEDEFKDGYMLNYLLDTEARESLLDLKMFQNPFNVELNTTRNNELVPTKVDMVDTFNYLIGLNVEKERWLEDDNICVVWGETHREHQKTMAIWRNQEKVDNAKLLECFEKLELRDLAKNVDVIYVNGENTLQSKIHDDENWQVMLTDEEFLNRMFEEE